MATLTGLSQRCVLDMVMRRERLGSTGISSGIAIHAVHDDLTRTVALFAVLKTPVDFDAIDRRPVDIVCLVVGPPNDETNNLNVSRVRPITATCVYQEKLRSVTSPEAVLAVPSICKWCCCCFDHTPIHISFCACRVPM